MSRVSASEAAQWLRIRPQESSETHNTGDSGMTGSRSGASGTAWRDGLCPQQVQDVGIGTQFYVRARSAEWSLLRVTVGAEPDFLRWAEHGDLVAEGPDEGVTPDETDELLTLPVGCE
jgi:hypothetical protein